MLTTDAVKAIQRAVAALEDAYDIVQGTEQDKTGNRLKWLATDVLSDCIGKVQGLLIDANRCK